MKKLALLLPLLLLAQVCLAEDIGISVTVAPPPIIQPPFRLLAISIGSIVIGSGTLIYVLRNIFAMIDESDFKTKIAYLILIAIMLSLSIYTINSLI